MLFDLRGKRRRVIQVIYAGLAILMGGGLVLFGIGGDVSGGLFDAFRDSGGARGGFEDQVEKLEKRLELKPRDRRILLELTRARFQNANSGGNVDPERGTYSEEGLTELERTADTWERYLKTKPPKPSVGAALLVVRAYDGLRDYEGAAETQQLVADARPSRGSLLQLANYRYYSNEFGRGDEAANRALARTPPAEREEIRRQLQLIRFGQQAIAAYLEGKDAKGDAAAEKAVKAAPSAQRSAVRRQLKELKKRAKQFSKLQPKEQEAPPPGAAPPEGSPFAFPQGGGAGL